MGKTTFITSSDSLLFDGFYDAVDNAWKDSAPKATDKWLRDIASNNPEQIPEKYRDTVLNGTKSSASEEQISDYKKLTEDFAYMVLSNREELKGKSPSPEGILKASYSILTELGFNKEQTDQLATGHGNAEYLNSYIEEAKKMPVSDFARSLGKKAQSDDITVQRYERKRQFVKKADGSEFPLIESENKKLREAGLGISDTNYMNPQGNDFAKELTLPKEGDISIFVPSPDLEKKVTKNNFEKISKPLEEVAQEGRLTIVNIHKNPETPGKESQRILTSRPPEGPKSAKIGNFEVNVDNIWEKDIGAYLANNKQQERAA